MKWNKKNKDYYINKGYRFASFGDSLLVRAEDLSHGSHANVQFYCDYCGREFAKTWKDTFKYENHTHCCRRCVGKKSNESALKNKSRGRNWYDRVLDSCNSKGYELLSSEEDLTNANSIVKYKCPKHGIKSARALLLAYHHGCKDCMYEEQDGKFKNHPEVLVDELEKHTIFILNPEQYQGWSVSNLKVTCQECGTTFTTSYANIRRSIRKGELSRCPKCTRSQSLGEEAIFNYLEHERIGFEREKRFSDCKDKQSLPFDFYIPKYNVVIEFMGKQHYEPISYWGGSLIPK